MTITATTPGRLELLAPILVQSKTNGGIHVTASQRMLPEMRATGARTICGKTLKPTRLYNESDTMFFHKTNGLCENCSAKLDNMITPHTIGA